MKMLLKLRSPFKYENDKDDTKNKFCKTSSYGNDEQSMNNKNSLVVGLRILVQISSKESNIVVKSAALRFRQQPKRTDIKSLEYSCYLKNCNLCNKGLSLDKEVYMYRGDEGFCSIECRERQIVLDEMKELEAYNNSKKKKIMLASQRNYSQYCNSGRQYETRIPLQELGQRKPLIALARGVNYNRYLVYYK